MANKQIINLTESELKKVINESVKQVISELDWKTYMNASRKREEQANNIRKKHSKEFPNSILSGMRNGYDDKSDSLENYAQQMFQKKHGKNGINHNYEGDSPSYKGRYSAEDDYDFDIKNPTQDEYWGGEKAKVRHYRYGIGIPHKNYGELRDDTFDFGYNNEQGFSGYRERRHTMNYNKDGEKYNPHLSSVGDEISMSKENEYNDRQERMAKDMENYYTNNHKYTKGKGWK